MATLRELRDERLKKLEKLHELGVNPYPAHTDAASDPDTTPKLTELKNDFAKYQDRNVGVVGRIIGIRTHGRIAFLTIKEQWETIQVFIEEPALNDADYAASELKFSNLNLLDNGDFIEAEGKLTKSRTGEITVNAAKIKILSKSLRPIPTTWDGFSNKEERFRRRYLDTNVNKVVYDRFIRRSHFWPSTREFLLSNGFIEINIPVLETTTGGADATPFITHMDALDQDFYLRISHELPLKRLLVAGYEKVFDIGPRFRNENYSDEHLPEHISMEWYWAYADWEVGMKFTERLLRFVADKTWATRTFSLANNVEVNLGDNNSSWPKLSFVDEMKKEYGLDVLNSSMEEIKDQLVKHKLEVEQTENRMRSVDKLWKKLRTSIIGPAFMVDIPAYLQPLAKTQPDNPQLSEQFNLIMAGTEMCKAYSELNDPVEQLKRFKEQQQLRQAGDKEAQMLDIDYIEALEYAMPPACGFGYSERLFWVLEGVTAREGVPFPQMRREIDSTTANLYKDIDLG
jgi:lysyl-tRNA synthetase class 2